MSLAIRTIKTGRWRENCYVVEGRAGEAVIIDPGANVDQIEEQVDRSGSVVKAILLTHGHFDHIGAVAPLRDRHRVECLLHQSDHTLVRRANFYRALFESEDSIVVPEVTALGHDGARLTIAGLDIEVLHTPGHTPGSVCYLIGDDMFSGDTMHRGSPGRVDLPGGDADALEVSLERLSRLGSETRVHPGHGRTTTIGAELDGGALSSFAERV